MLDFRRKTVCRRSDLLKNNCSDLSSVFTLNFSERCVDPKVERMEISIQIPVKEVDDILIMMAPDIGEMDKERVVKEFVSLGYQHFYEWLSSNKHYLALTGIFLFGGLRTADRLEEEIEAMFG